MALNEWAFLAEAVYHADLSSLQEQLEKLGKQAALGRKVELQSHTSQTPLLPLSEGEAKLEQRLEWCEQDLAILKTTIKKGTATT